MKTARIYDFDTREITEIPLDELAPGFCLVTIEGIKGYVYVDASKLMQADYKHPPLVDYRPIFEVFSETFKEVYPRTAQEWEDGFRRDTHPEKEIAAWGKIASAFDFCLAGINPSLPVKKNYFQLLLNGFACGFDEEKTLAVVPLDAITLDEAKKLIQSTKGRAPETKK